MRAGKIAAVVIVIASALVGCREEPPPPDQPGRASGPPVFAYATSSKVRVARGEAVVADLPISAKDSGMDGEWTPDGARFVFSTNKKLVSVDAASGAAVEVSCKCGGIAIAAGTVYVLAEYNGKELAAYDAATLVPKGTLKPLQPNARGMLSVAGAGDRLVTFQITADGARPVTDVVVVDPKTGAATKVGDSFDGGLVQSTAYTPRDWAGKPMFAYVGLKSHGASHGVASVVLIDPVNPAQQVVGDNGHLLAKAATVQDPNIDQGSAWWSWDGKLGVTARLWTCERLGRCTDHTPNTQWRYDGKEWTAVDDRGLASTRGLGGGTVELSGGSATGTEKQRITLVMGERRTSVATDVLGLWTPPSPPPPPSSDGTVTVVNLNAAMGFKIGAGERRGTNAKPEDLEKLADDLVRQDADIANLQEMAKPAAKEVAAILARRTGREWRLNWAGSGKSSYYRGEDENEPPVYDQVSSGNAQLVQIGDGVLAQRPLTVDTVAASDGEQDQGVMFDSGGRSFQGTEITTERHGIVDVYNTHLARSKDAPDEARAKDVVKLQGRTESRPHPVILTGDFNLVIDGKGDEDAPLTVAAVGTYMNRLGYADLGRDLGPTSNYQFPEYMVGRKRIDYVLVRGVATHGTAKFTSHRSDHWGLVTRIGPG
ncbi:endonuclease/exonuclease/phosphatase family protein [Allokutzneria sp. A3M-2-11 16]|uniref:endonuclease/exonuclease/phosphatase family protein n=1 Tax=Allokutzneria sp. A3M-2-11 16 TaxID=2962043 RepID=UPI0020B8D258|nr:endonuclease/exonuclease/phosphatase family protein [Allokutzneria sp. A3M-2-11 16]MCP3804620.1 endonuclease/exonuclease/phosphatase family protein [Allokutzneria sp. A3M-2-11 16]